MVQRLPAGVRGVRLGACGLEPRERLGDQIGTQIGHPAQEDQAELPPSQSMHEFDPVTMPPC